MTAQPVRVELFYDGAWHDLVSDDDVLTEQPITIVRGQGDQSPGIRPTSVTLRLANDDDRYRVSNPESPLYGKVGRNTPMRVYVGASFRAIVQVATWKARQSTDFRRYPRRGKAWVDVYAVGLTGQVLQWRQKLRSALYRAVQFGGITPAEWWPMEDEPGSSRAISASSGGAPMVPVGSVRYTLPTGAAIPPGGAPEFARGAGIRGSDLLVSFQGGGTLAGPIRRRTFNGYCIDWVMQFQPGSDAGGTTSADILRWRETGTYAQFTVNVTKDYITVFHATPASLVTLSDVGSAVAPVDFYDGTPHHCRYQVRQSGGNYSATLLIDSASYSTSIAENFATPGAMAGTVGVPTAIEWNPGEQSGDFMPTAAGHLVVWSSGQIGDQPATFFHLDGRARERASYRLNRVLGNEQGIPLVVSASFTRTTEMGAQRPDTLADLITEITATEDGLVFDARDTARVQFTSRWDRYNQTPVVDLRPEDFTVLPAEEVVDDIRNVVTVAQRDGGDATARDDTSAAGTLPPPAGLGVYEQRVDVNVFRETDLPFWAGYWLRRLTVDVPRFPVVSVTLSALPAARARQIERLDIGDVFTITALRENVIRVHVLGYTETIGQHGRVIAFNVAPDDFFTVATYGVTRYDLATCTVAAAAGPTATTISLALTADESWSTTAAFDVMISGELVGVPAGGAGARGGVPGAYTQTLTGVTRSKNGVRKLLPVGAAVRVANPGRYGVTGGLL